MIASLSALAIGFVFVGSGSRDVEREDKYLDEKWARFMVLGLAFLYLGKCVFVVRLCFVAPANYYCGWL